MGLWHYEPEAFENKEDVRVVSKLVKDEDNKSGSEKEIQVINKIRGI